MWHVDNLNDAEALLAFLQQDRVYAAYAIGDVEPAYAAAAAWFGAWREETLAALALVYSGLEPPVLFTMGAPAGLQAIMAHGGEHAPDAFSPSQVAEGVFYGIYAGAELAAAGGTHLVARQVGVGAVGNIYTHPAHRRQGYATLITSAVTASLLADRLTVVLNVNELNAPALAVYTKLGYRAACRFVEGIGRQVVEDRRSETGDRRSEIRDQRSKISEK